MLPYLCLLCFALLCNAACNGDWSVDLPSSSNVINDQFDTTISGSAGSYAIDITSNSGTITQGNRVTNVVSNFQIPWDATTLYAFIGADSTGIMMGWAYCDGNQLTDVWLEDTTGQAGFTSPRVSGTCSVRQAQKSAQLSTSERCYAINKPPGLPTINGVGLKLTDGNPGSVILQGTTYDLLPFAMVDCKTCKSSNLNGGWMEVHAVMRSTSNVCLGIFYLQVIPKDTIALNYINCFFSMVSDTEFKAQYQLAQGSSVSTTKDQSTVVSALPPVTVSEVINTTGLVSSAATTTASVLFSSSSSGAAAVVTQVSGTIVSTAASISSSTATANANSSGSTSSRVGHISPLGLLVILSAFLIINDTG